MKRILHCISSLLIACMGLLASSASSAEIRIGVVLSLTGPGASVGLPEQNAVTLWPAEMVGHKVVVTVVNDASDPSAAARSVSRLVNEDKVDVIVGSSLTPTSLAMVPVAAQLHIPMISLAGGGAIVEPMDERRRWAFRLGVPERFSTDLIAEDVKRHKGSTIAIMALASAYGDGYLKSMETSAASRGVKVVGVERFNVTDQSVTAQIAKLMLLNPDAIFVGAAGTSGTLPQIELTSRRYAGRVYQTSGVANGDFLRVAGKSAEGMFITVLPLMVAEQLKEGDPLRMPSQEFVRAYETLHGAGTRSGFGASAFDSYRLIENAARMTLRKVQPGTEAFRVALRDALEQTRDVPTTTLNFAFSEANHTGLDQRSQVLAVVKGGKWRLAN
ncbi:ABC transporter substrate-binding protein [Variovorax sp. Root411]|uniref:ABC transporter substrate-binding protein n=1 Tax=Variovorax sp. Root411 TaxID=1736530 RepID=UPI0006F9ED88|nr:ABC transporter substrate-binding protein [Variovorax sp. Root411]KQW54280.1 branched-chain amino acid ABC transporter substrate-binding protein [Variovorax sp. Root411]